ncbi:unnamed protein product [Protopolystoma xenopodis]|uniref:Uncharacterized protein n=1 Tax=Protopolystoma xenopodis TaxID=117903 RepID=A0A3S5AUT8_9PLAT|nr:unnamed protein product [Protopolystoma xenopodis]
MLARNQRQAAAKAEYLRQKVERRWATKRRAILQETLEHLGLAMQLDKHLPAPNSEVTTTSFTRLLAGSRDGAPPGLM